MTERKDNYDYKMAKYIWKILQSSIIPFSWGIDFSTVSVIENGTEFHVQGFKITGKVKIQYVHGLDLFRVDIIPDDEKEENSVFEEVYLDTLISTIDVAVEKTENYEERVAEEYPIFRDPYNPDKVRPVGIIAI